jgi:phage gpG-like protein
MGVVVRNLQALRDLQRKLDAASRARLMPETVKRIAAAFDKQVKDEFRYSRDPYGRAWKPVRRNRLRDQRARARRVKRGLPPRQDKPLIDSGRMRASIYSRAVGTEVRISIPVDYASFHQYGTRVIARRQILPEKSTGGLPPKWKLAAEKEVNAVLKKHFGEGR